RYVIRVVRDAKKRPTQSRGNHENYHQTVATEALDQTLRLTFLTGESVAGCADWPALTRSRASGSDHYQTTQISRPFTRRRTHCPVETGEELRFVGGSDGGDTVPTPMGGTAHIGGSRQRVAGDQSGAGDASLFHTRRDTHCET